MEQYKIEKGIFTADDISAMLKNCFPSKKAVEKIISKYQSALSPILISNSQAILIDGDSVKVQ